MSAFGGKAENICLILSLSGFDPVVGPGADIPSPEQLVAVRIPLAPFQDPDGCETMRCVVLTPGGDYETPGVDRAIRRCSGMALRGACAAAINAEDRVPQLLFVVRCVRATLPGRIPSRSKTGRLRRG